jgi:hypothetical protein
VKRDLRHYARQTNTRLVVGFLVLLFLVGDGLIYLIYGQRSAVMGLICLLMGLAPVFLIWVILMGFELIVKRFGDR